MYYILRLRALIRWQITHTHVVLNLAPVTDYILNQIGSRENSQPVSGSLKRFELFENLCSSFVIIYTRPELEISILTHEVITVWCQQGAWLEGISPLHLYPSF